MKAGQLRNLVTVQRLSSAIDVLGGSTNEWVDFATVWASIEPVTGREMQAAQQTNSAVTHRISMRHLPGVTAAMRVVHNQKEYHIVAVMNVDARDRETRLVVSDIFRESAIPLDDV